MERAETYQTNFLSHKVQKLSYDVFTQDGTAVLPCRLEQNRLRWVPT